MPRGNKIQIRTGTTTPSASDFATSEPAWDAAAGRLYIKSNAGTMVEVGANASVSVYSSASSFPGTGTANAIYLDTSTSRIYRWVAADSVYAEIGAIGGLYDFDGGTFGA